MEFMSTTGERGENSIHNVERIGDTSYTAKGLLDFKELQFVSCDDKYDRCAINESLFNENGLDDNAVPLKDKIKENIPSFSQDEIGSYRLVNGIGYNSERGFLFSNEDMLNMTKWLFRQISKLSINNATGFARINKLSYRFIYENSSFLEGDINKSEWINVNSQDDIESINFDIKDNYAKIY